MKGVLLLSGGIDSPVAGYLLGRQGVDLVAIHFDTSHEEGSGEVDKVLQLMRRMDEALDTTTEKIIIRHGAALDTLSSRCSPNLACVLCRRIMLRVAGKFAEARGAAFIVTGESLGQVASQTLQNIFAEEEAASVPVLRPLIGMDKLEIERIAKEIGTYEISVSTGSSCVHAPDRPATYASLEAVLKEESTINVKEIVDEEMRSARTV